MKTLSALLNESSSRLQNANLETPRLDAEVLLCRALGLSRETFWCEPGRVVTADQIPLCEQWIRRREQREPLAYIIEEREFWSRPFKVTPDVLIPRPESELLIEHLLKDIPQAQRGGPFHGLDLCTGSGALAIISALELEDCRMVGVDVSRRALEIARENGRRQGVDDRLRWICCDLLKELAIEGTTPAGFDFILCNPPYLGQRDMQSLQPEIDLYEPSGALDGGPDGQRFYPEIIRHAITWLKPGGRLLMEIGREQGSAICSLLEEADAFDGVTRIRDYSGNDRVVSALKGA